MPYLIVIVPVKEGDLGHVHEDGGRGEQQHASQALAGIMGKSVKEKQFEENSEEGVKSKYTNENEVRKLMKMQAIYCEIYTLERFIFWFMFALIL